MKVHKHLLKPVTADVKVKNPLNVPKKVKAGIVEFTCGLVDLPALKKKYLSKKKQLKIEKSQKRDRRKSFMAPEENDDKIIHSASVFRKSKIGKEISQFKIC